MTCSNIKFNVDWYYHNRLIVRVAWEGGFLASYIFIGVKFPKPIFKSFYNLFISTKDITSFLPVLIFCSYGSVISPGQILIIGTSSNLSIFHSF